MIRNIHQFRAYLQMRRIIYLYLLTALKYVQSQNTADQYGNNINAGKPDTKISVKAKLFYIKEGETEGTEV